MRPPIYSLDLTATTWSDIKVGEPCREPERPAASLRVEALRWSPGYDFRYDDKTQPPRLFRPVFHRRTLSAAVPAFCSASCLVQCRLTILPWRNTAHSLRIACPQCVYDLIQHRVAFIQRQ
jgi:hypothetical protein